MFKLICVLFQKIRHWILRANLELDKTKVGKTKHFVICLMIVAPFLIGVNIAIISVNRTMLGFSLLYIFIVGSLRMYWFYWTEKYITKYATKEVETKTEKK